MFSLTSVEAFCAVVKNKSFSAAAKDLYISQSAISMRIKYLEDETDLQLLIRNKSKVELTYEGQIIYEYAEKLLALSKEMTAAAANLKKGERGTFTIAASAIVNSWILPNILRRVYKDYPNVDIIYRTCFTSEIIPLVIGGEINFGIIRTDEPNFSDVRLNHKILGRDRVFFVAHPGHSVFTLSEVNLKVVSKAPLIMYGSNPGHSPYFKRIFGALNLFPNNVIYLNDLSAAKKLTEFGTHICCLSEVGIYDDVKNGSLKIIEISDYTPIYRYSTLIYRKDCELRGAIKEFLKLIDVLGVFDYSPDLF